MGEKIKAVFTSKEGYYVYHKRSTGTTRIWKDGLTIFRGTLTNIKQINKLKELCVKY